MARRLAKKEGQRRDERQRRQKWGTRRIANASHINKREDTVCEAAEKPPSL